MNKGLMLKSLAAAVAIYGAAGFFGVPYLLKNVVPSTVAEVTKGGEFAVKAASFNPFSLHLVLKEVTFKTPQKGDLFALGEFSINIDPLAYLWRGGLVIDDIRLSDPKITLYRDPQGDFNFKWLTELGEKEEEEKPSEPMRLMVNHLSLQKGALHYRDDAEGGGYVLDLGPIGFHLDHIDLRDLSGANGKMRLYATINEGGFIDLKGKIDTLSPFAIGGNLEFDSGKLYTPWRYFKEKFPIEVADGSASFGFDYRFDAKDINATELSHLHFNMDKVRIIPKGEERNLFTLGTLRLVNGSVQPMRKIFDARSLHINGVSVAARRSHAGKIDWLDYIETIQKAFPSDDNETKEPWTYRIGSVAVENVSSEWSDNAPTEAYRARLQNLSLYTDTVSSDEKALLNLRLSTGALSVVRQRDGFQSVGLEGIGIDGVEINREGKYARVQKVSLLQPEVAVKRLKDGTVDVSKYIYAPPEKRGKAASSDKAPWGYRIDEIALHNGSAAFIDEVPSKEVSLKLDRMNLNVRDIENDPKVKNTLIASTRINGKSTLSLKSDVVRSPLSSKGEVDIKAFDVSLIDPYIEPSTYASLRRGNLSLSAQYAYTPAKTGVKGKVSLSDWVVNDARDNSVLLGWDRIGVTPFLYAYPDNRLKINQLGIDGLYTNALIDAKKVLNYTTLSKKTPSESNATKQEGNPFGMDIVKLVLRGSSATFSDLSLPLPFKTYIHDLEGSVLGISTTKDVTTFVKLGGGVDQYGSAKIDGSLNTKDPKKFTDIGVVFNNLELKNYTPYSLEFMGYKIDGGKLFLNLGYKIEGGQLNGANQVVIKKIELGDEKEGGAPWPMPFVLALLEDKEGVIDINLPIEGDVNNPDFKYGKVVWQVIGNLFTKAVTSPFRLLSSMMGIENDTLSSVDFEAGSSHLLPPQTEKLDQVAAMLAKRPKLMLNLYGGYDETLDSYALKAQKLIVSAAKRTKEGKIDSLQGINVELLEEMARERLDKQELKELKSALQTQYTEEAAFVRHFSEALVGKLVPIQPLTPQELQSLGHQRAEMIRNYLIRTPGYDKRITLKGSEPVKGAKREEIPARMEIVIP
ncbi:MAG: DUF748 domain-containing protein [Sulfuricurvum sp.]|nr:DUF748 domain-containing protein [Sulfuricurvum sp.]